MRGLFLCKINEVYGSYSYARKSSGLWNSTRFVVESLILNGVKARLREVVAGNCIDREIAHSFHPLNPDVVVLEALWVTPTEIEELQRLYPQIKFMVHLHSNLPFLAIEGIAVEWLHAYSLLEVGVITNCKRAYAALNTILDPSQVIFLPNVYSHKAMVSTHQDPKVMDIACFGAIRLFKNQFIQAMAAVQFAREKRMHLRFHMNTSRIELR